ncbi:hypothetical protein CRUP_029743 [Coryphaenoides rupestris]|nr:hypothetical protein CRUP_029743 [Coryphaenoides rupestris]
MVSKEEKAAPRANVAAASSAGRNLWVSGLSSTTRATDLKTLFSKHGTVVGAKVVTNAKSPGARCYGFISMSSAVEARVRQPPPPHQAVGDRPEGRAE